MMANLNMLCVIMKNKIIHKIYNSFVVIIQIHKFMCHHPKVFEKFWQSNSITPIAITPASTLELTYTVFLTPPYDKILPRNT